MRPGWRIQGHTIGSKCLGLSFKWQTAFLSASLNTPRLPPKTQANIAGIAAFIATYPPTWIQRTLNSESEITLPSLQWVSLHLENQICQGLDLLRCPLAIVNLWPQHNADAPCDTNMASTVSIALIWLSSTSSIWLKVQHLTLKTIIPSHPAVWRKAWWAVHKNWRTPQCPDHWMFLVGR